jgi:hypothetical protein
MMLQRKMAYRVYGTILVIVQAVNPQLNLRSANVMPPACMYYSVG